ncbi:glutamyl-tRNA reductase [Hymenobacter humi]|uniref:Glutamyl-tRNA reductase n=1 Tax=Hymenobacter humi TaxID=1411620 RepID=A0ABW2U2A1_9BACT
MTFPFQAVSLSHKKTPLAIRELLALNEAACDQLLRTLTEEMGLTDVLVLSTCNRTEVYYTAQEDQSAAIIAVLGQVTGVAAIEEYRSHFTVIAGADAAAQHLFEVALGLDAQVVGDLQISSQVKKPTNVRPMPARPDRFCTACCTRCWPPTSACSAKPRSATEPLPLPTPRSSLVEELTAAVAQPRVLIVGLGEIGADVCRHFGKSKRFAEVTICNRTPATAQALAAECGLQVLDFANLAQGLQEADVVISSIAAPSPFFTREMLAQLTILSPKFFIDLSVPRSIEAEAEQVPGVLVYNIDALLSKASAALASRVAAIPQVQAIVAESMDTLRTWSQEMQVSPTIQKLKNTLEQFRQQEIGRFQKQLSADEASRLNDITKALTQKFLKLPVLQLKAACQRGESDQLVAMLTEIFGLEEVTNPALAA